MSKIDQDKRIFQSIRINLLIVLLIVFSCEIIFAAAENITIDTKTDNLFENLISDTLLLLDPELKKTIADDFDNVVKNSNFKLVVNSWMPRPNPKTKLVSIYDRFNANNVKESLSSLVQPVVEIACTSQKYDPMNEYQSKCIKELFKYPIIQPIEIQYIYESGKTKEQLVANLTGLNESNRYQKIVSSIADIMNSGYEKVSKKSVAKNVNVVKYPLQIVQGGSSSVSARVYDNKSAPKSRVELEKERLKNKLASGINLLSANSKGAAIFRDHMNKRINELEKNPEQYFYDQSRRDAESKSRRPSPPIVNGVQATSIGGGNYIDSRNGNFLQGVAGGAIDPKTGKFYPK